MTTSVIAYLPVTDAALMSDMAEAALDGNDKSMTYLAEQEGGANLATVKRLAATHGADYDGYGTDGKTLEIFIYAKGRESAEALVGALKAAGIEAKVGRDHNDDEG